MAEYLGLTDVPLWAPSGATPAALTYPGVAWQWTAWTEVAPAVGSEGAALAAVHWIPGSGNPSSGRHQDLQVGVGAAGAETPIATLRAMGATYPQYTSSNGGLNYLPALLDLPANARVAVRYRSNAAHSYGNGWAVVAYLNKPLAGTRLVTARPVIAWPSTATVCPSFVSPAAWAWSAWAEILASAPFDLAIFDVATFGFSITNLGQFEIQVGVGAAGAETPNRTLRSLEALSAPSSSFALVGAPVGVAISAASRVALRVRGRLDQGEPNLFYAVHYQQLPL
jgi:hypothetical protein